MAVLADWERKNGDGYMEEEMDDIMTKKRA
jgi:hypothetical protein